MLITPPIPRPFDAVRLASSPSLLILITNLGFSYQEHKSFSKEADAQPTPPAFDHEDSACIVEGIDVSFSNTNPGTLPPCPLPVENQPTPLPRETPGHAIHGSASEADSNQGVADSYPDVANDTVKGSRSGSEGLAIGDAAICDLLLGYFRHLAEDFCHAKEVGWEELYSRRLSDDLFWCAYLFSEFSVSTLDCFFS